MPFTLAPGIALYPAGAAPPAVAHGCLALAHLAQQGVFGDGSHPTTRMCAAAVDVLCRRRGPQAVLDVGTGTGVLARIARARGAAFVAATDIDPVALSAAEANSALDEHPVRIHVSSEAPDYWGARFELVVANILEEPLRLLAPALNRALVPGGALLLSGFTRPQTPAIRVFYHAKGFRLASESRLDEWTLLMFERE